MPTTNTYYKQDMSTLAYQLSDPYANLVYNQVFPAMNAGAELGKFRKKDARTWFEELRSMASKFTTPESHNTTDAFLDFKIDPISSAFEFSNADLGQATSRGYPSAAAMIQEEMAVTMYLLKKLKEKALYTFVSDNSNFQGATYYANAGTAWSTTTTADSLDDIMAGRTIVEAGGYRLNAGIISNTALNYLQQHASIQSSTTVMGSARDGSVNPFVTVDFLKNYWNLDHLWIASGALVTDSSDPTDSTIAEIWGDSMLLFDYNANAIQSPRQPSWLKHLFWRPDGKGDSSEGWIVNESQKGEVGGVGVRKWGIWDYYTFLSHEKKLAYRIDNLY